MSDRIKNALSIFHPHPQAKPGNCAEAIFESFETDPDSRPRSEYRRLAKGRAPGGVCGAYHAGAAILERARPDLVREFESRFKSKTGCTGCRAIRRAGQADCRDCVLATAEYLDQALYHSDQSNRLN